MLIEDFKKFGKKMAGLTFNGLFDRYDNSEAAYLFAVSYSGRVEVPVGFADKVKPFEIFFDKEVVELKK